VDKVSLQNVLNATMILIDPDIDEVVKFKEGYVFVCCTKLFIYSHSVVYGCI